MSLFQMEYMTYEGNDYYVLFYVTLSFILKFRNLLSFGNLANENIHIYILLKAEA